MKLAIIGSRSFINKELLYKVIDTHFSVPITEIISGGAAGADSLGAQWGWSSDVKVTEFKPDWSAYGKAAGIIRNKDIIREAEFVLAFWDGVSKGTQHSIGEAKRLKKPTLIIYF